MENEYSHLEQLVNDVTNLDTARMTLRWALERLHALEKSNAELKRDSAAAQAAREQAEQKVRSVGQSMESRSKALDEQEGFHKKMEATLDLLSGGKIDVTHLVRKEAQLDQLRRELEEDYQRRFENLDKTQAQIAQRWNQRLLSVESRYAERLSESQSHYDGLRQGLEKEYQARLARLEESFRSREKELLERVNSLEESASRHDNAVEDRRTRTELELSAKKTELAHNYQKLKSSLETNFDARVRILEGEHVKRLKSLETTWGAERNRLLEEQHTRENQFKTAQDRIKELEESLARQQGTHHDELLKQIREGETGFRDRENRLQEELRNRETEVSRLKEAAIRSDAEWSERLRKLEHEVIWKKVAELDMKYHERVTGLKARENELRIKFEEMFHQRVVEHDADMKVLREGSDKERRQLRAEITVRDTTVRNVTAEADLIAREAIKETSGLKTKLEAARRDMESDFRDRAEWLESALKNRETEVSRLKEATVRNDAEWGERLRKLEHEVIWKKVAELDLKYNERRVELENKTRTVQSQAEGEVKKLKDEFETNLAAKRAEVEESFRQRVARYEEDMKTLRSGFDEERARLWDGMNAREAFVRELTQKLDSAKQELLKDRAEQKSRWEDREAKLVLEHRNEIENFLGELRSRDEELLKMKEQAAQKDDEWTEKIRRLEHEIPSRKIAELEKEYRKRWDEHDADMKALREGFDNERRQWLSEVSAREAMISEISAEAGRMSQDTLREIISRHKKKK